MLRRRPAAPLRGLVDDYSGYALHGLPLTMHRGLPSRWLTVVLAIDEPLELAAMPDPRQPPGVFQAAFGGLHSSPARIRMDTHHTGIHLALTPRGARTLFGVTAGELGSRVVHLDEVVGRSGGELLERVHAESTWPRRFEALDGVLLSWLRDRPKQARPEVVWAWDRLVADGGAPRVQDLADDVGWSRRHLNQRFRDEFGLPPKVAARVVRFERARRMFEEDPRASLARVAVSSGYSDQAHLTREWQALAGCSPARWLREEFPYFQDWTDVEEPESSA
ncbi:MAG: helix-turn-helix domain-containing protein [Propionibacteriales bacterium]|nr:helix-turn-helix domain-containing protein [Propionibacteriales bacterium]